MTAKYRLAAYIIAFTGLFTSIACDDGKESIIPIGNNIFYKRDGRIINGGSPIQIEVDINNDEIIDFLIFSVLTSNQDGDHLYFGIKPIDSNMVKSGFPNDDYYLNMGLIKSEDYKSIINNKVDKSEVWTSSRNILVIKHIDNRGNSWCEGSLKNEDGTFIGITHTINQKNYYGWLKLKFDKALERVTLMEYAYCLNVNSSIGAGQKE